MIFNPFHKDYCPLCQATLIWEHSRHECPRSHYRFCNNNKYVNPWVRIVIPDFVLVYDSWPKNSTQPPSETSIHKNAIYYPLIFKLAEFLPIDWDNPQITSNRIKKLIPYL